MQLLKLKIKFALRLDYYYGLDVQQLELHCLDRQGVGRLVVPNGTLHA